VRAFDRSYYPIHRFWEIDRTVALLILIPTVLLALFGVVRSFKGKQIPLWVVVLSVFWMGALWFGWYALGDEVAELILGAGALNGWFILNYIALRQSGTRSVDVSSAMGVLMLIAVLAVKPWAATVALSDYEDTVYIETYYDYAQTQPKEIQKKHKYKYYGTSRFYHENGMPEAIRIHDKQGREKHSEYFNTDGCLTKKDSVWFVEDAGLYIPISKVGNTITWGAGVRFDITVKAMHMACIWITTAMVRFGWLVDLRWISPLVTGICMLRLQELF